MNEFDIRLDCSHFIQDFFKLNIRKIIFTTFFLHWYILILDLVFCNTKVTSIIKIDDRY